MFHLHWVKATINQTTSSTSCYYFSCRSISCRYCWLGSYI